MESDIKDNKEALYKELAEDLEEQQTAIEEKMIVTSRLMSLMDNRIQNFEEHQNYLNTFNPTLLDTKDVQLNSTLGFIKVGLATVKEEKDKMSKDLEFDRAWYEGNKMLISFVKHGAVYSAASLEMDIKSDKQNMLKELAEALEQQQTAIEEKMKINNYLISLMDNRIQNFRKHQAYLNSIDSSLLGPNNVELESDLRYIEGALNIIDKEKSKMLEQLMLDEAWYEENKHLIAFAKHGSEMLSIVATSNRLQKNRIPFLSNLIHLYSLYELSLA
ncbi:hypothetical protein HELRODRAFT_177967 [Helobdella robusta]|uniref:Inhibitor of growth protein N-terminal histone-binding domain-containing protein n=1 Tax=Helobdella robusta TaxID=6412 RepID=T1FCJ3_HELRO|nr:hypothetical protein HELRODRAFT_177967 [Helobdella robusta]ESN97536.1 hypothetical protein HELRODRAFT_177967 [Helobdella robusta]